MVPESWADGAAGLLSWLGAYWWLATLALVLFVVGRRRSVRDAPPGPRATGDRQCDWAGRHGDSTGTP